VTEKPRLLVVDDDPIILALINNLAEVSGFSVEATDNPRSFLGLIERFKPDGLIIDIVMPEMDGFEVIRTLRDIDRRVPILLISAHPDEYLGLAKDMMECFQPTGVSTMAKPLSVDGLHAFLETIHKP
jgi:CheY-like chemotaxis protein